MTLRIEAFAGHCGMCLRKNEEVKSFIEGVFNSSYVDVARDPRFGKAEELVVGYQLCPTCMEKLRGEL